eukprot:6210679-Pyramimonas_sp.AAC.1
MPKAEGVPRHVRDDVHLVRRQALLAAVANPIRIEPANQAHELEDVRQAQRALAVGRDANE